MTNPTPRSIRYVVLHKPGPKWQYGIDYREQPGAGGMMVTTKEVSQEEIETLAATDPAVRSGLLIYEIRPWSISSEKRRGRSHVNR